MIKKLLDLFFISLSLGAFAQQDPYEMCRRLNAGLKGKYLVHYVFEASDEALEFRALDSGYAVTQTYLDNGSVFKGTVLFAVRGGQCLMIQSYPESQTMDAIKKITLKGTEISSFEVEYSLKAIKTE